MRRLSFIKVLICILLIGVNLVTTGCALFDVDKNKNSYKIQPIDFIPVENLEVDDE